MQNKAINQRIEGTNLYVFSQDKKTGLVTYSRPLLVDEAQAVATAVNQRIKTEYENARGLGNGLQVTENGSLYNMSTLKGILANQELMQQSKNALWFPTIQEGRLLHNAKLLPSGELMDFGLALYSDASPDAEIATFLSATARKGNYTLPLLASFKALGLKLGGERYGVTPTLTSQDGLLTGADAQKMLEGFDYTAKTGVHGVDRSGGGCLVADWGGILDSSGGGCRVGRVAAEGSERDVKALVQAQIKAQFTQQRTDLEAKLAELKAGEQATIASAETVFK